MSDNWIILIPKNPNYIPPRDKQEQAVAYFKSIAPDSDDITTEATEQIRFIDCGANFEKILCPSCQREIDMDWWQDQMAAEAADAFPLRSIDLPCCKAQKTLNELLYDWPQGFARFSIEAMNPNIGDLSENQQKALESLWGCQTRKILQHI